MIAQRAITPGLVPGVHSEASSAVPFWVYIQASAPRGTLYIGMTEDLKRRSREHARGRGSVFTRKYGVGQLVWYARYETEAEARQRERTMKEWPRAWKINTIAAMNPEWRDLSQDLPPKA